MSRFIYYYAKCHYTECSYAGRRYAECSYAGRRYTECSYAGRRYTECSNAGIVILSVLMLNVSVIMMGVVMPLKCCESHMLNILKYNV